MFIEVLFVLGIVFFIMISFLIEEKLNSRFYKNKQALNNSSGFGRFLIFVYPERYFKEELTNKGRLYHLLSYICVLIAVILTILLINLYGYHFP